MLAVSNCQFKKCGESLWVLYWRRGLHRHLCKLNPSSVTLIRNGTRRREIDSGCLPVRELLGISWAISGGCGIFENTAWSKTGPGKTVKGYRDISASNDEEAVDMIRSGNWDQESVLLGQPASDWGNWLYVVLHEGRERYLQIKGLQIHGSEETCHLGGLVAGFVVRLSGGRSLKISWGGVIWTPI